MSGWWLVVRCGGVGRGWRAWGIIGEFEPNGVENWESMEGEVGDFGGVVLRLLGMRGIWWDERGRAGEDCVK